MVRAQAAVTHPSLHAQAVRAEIEPVAARDFLRFLFDWQHMSADTRMAGPKALDGVTAQLEGFEAPAAAWESEILPSRLAGYEPGWLDERCLAGHIVWTRLRLRNGRTNGGGRPAPVRTTSTFSQARPARTVGFVPVQQ